MAQQIPTKMKAAAFDRYGPPEVLHVELLPTPEPAEGEVLIQVDTAGVGAWDPDLRAGEFEMGKKGFPRIIGNDGSGRIVALGKNVKGFHLDEEVYSYAWEGGFYAEFAAIPSDSVAPVPPALGLDEAGALGADGVTALLGLENVLHLGKGERLLVFGASGGIGHLAVQLARRMGAMVSAVASGDDGVQLVHSLGVRDVVEGHDEELLEKLRIAAPSADAALVLAGGPQADLALTYVKRGGRVAFPNGVEPEPHAPEGVHLKSYDGTPSPEALARLNELIGERPFKVVLGQRFPLEEAAAAHEAVTHHHLGKVALHVHHLR